MRPTQDGHFVARDGLRLDCYRRDAESPVAPVVILHGLDDHSRSSPYVALGDVLVSRGLSVFAFDRRGSGRSEGPRNYAETFDDLRDDLCRFVDLVEDQTGQLPYLAGLSFGGMQSLDFALQRPESVRGVVALAPALDVSGTSSILRALLPLLAALVPKISVKNGLDLDGTVKDPVVRQAYVSDPLWNRKTTPALGAAALGAIAELHERAATFQVPLLTFHGTADRIVPIQGTRDFMTRVGSKDRTYVEVEGAFHALPIEPEGQSIADQSADWILNRVPAT